MFGFSIGAATSVGVQRSANQDSYGTSPRVAIVADGMGGHRGGEVASSIAVREMIAQFDQPQLDALVASVEHANKRILDEAAASPHLHGMGTTVVALGFIELEDGIALGAINVGDSRMYRLTGKVLEQLTEDHSLVEALVREGRITQAEAEVHPQRNIVTRALGVTDLVEVDTFHFIPKIGDRYLLCSDGLVNEVDPHTIATILATEPDPQAAVDQLIEAANAGGGRDNITTVVADIVAADDAAMPAVASELAKDPVTLDGEPGFDEPDTGSSLVGRGAADSENQRNKSTMKAFFVGRHRRNGELVLIILGGLVTTGAYVLASLGRLSSIPANVGPFLGVVLGLFFAAHVATRFLAPEADGLLLPLAGLLNGLGYVFIARLDDDLAAQQALWTFIGVGLYVATLWFVSRSRDLERYRYTFLLIGLGLLVLPLLPVFGQTVNGSRIWVRFGPVNFQPGEFAKVALSIFFAGYIVDKRELFKVGTWKLGPLRLPEPKHSAPLLLAWGMSLVVMISQKDLGTSLLFFMLFLIVLWVGTERLSFLLVGLVLFAGGAFVAWTRFDHVKTRVDTWLNPWDDPLGSGFQVVEAQFGLASGGLTGSGPGRGYPQRVPAAETDFIFSTIGEELGLLGGTAVLMAFVLMIGSGLRAALGASRPFSKLLATGLTGLLGVQAFIIVAGVTRVLPLTGVTLPFVSYGGSSLLANYAILALLMRISDEQVDRPADAPSRTRRRPKVAA